MHFGVNTRFLAKDYSKDWLSILNRALNLSYFVIVQDVSGLLDENAYNYVFVYCV